MAIEVLENAVPFLEQRSKINTNFAYLNSLYVALDGITMDHIASELNPHSVTKTQVGLGNADNVADADKIVSSHQQTALNLKADATDLVSHEGDTSNPHTVTATQIGVENVDNTSDADKPISTAQQAALDLKVAQSDEGYTVTPPAAGELKELSEATTTIGTLTAFVLTLAGTLKDKDVI